MIIKRISILTCLLLALTCLPALGAESIKFKPISAAYNDNKNVPLRYPEGVACWKSTVTVADAGNGRLVRYNLVNDELKDGIEIKHAQLGYPVRVKATPKGEILALDGKTRKIARITPEGAFTAYLDPQKVPAPDFVPRSFAIDAKENIYLLDIYGERVLVLDPAASFVRQIPFPKDFEYIADVTVDGKGNVYIVDSIKGELHKAASAELAFSLMAKDLGAYVNFAVSIEIDAQGRVYLLDQNDNGVVVLGQDGKFFGRYLNAGWKHGQLSYPGQGCFADNFIYAIADRNNNRVQIYKTQ